MASSSGTSSGTSSQLQHSGSEGDLQINNNNGGTDQRKQKRMLSNRESARRSRMRKQKHLDDLMAQVAQLRKENNQILTSVNITTQHYLNVDSENSILRAQMAELNNRLQSLTEISHYLNANNMVGDVGGVFGTTEEYPYQMMNNDSFMNPWNMLYMNQQPIMASADTMFQY